MILPSKIKGSLKLSSFNLVTWRDWSASSNELINNRMFENIFLIIKVSVYNILIYIHVISSCIPTLNVNIYDHIVLPKTCL